MDARIKKLAYAGVMCGITMLLTMVSIPLPSGNGFVNLGDAAVFLCAVVLSPLFGPFAAGIGAALADIILGFAVYAPATLVIKGLAAFVCMLLCRHFTGRLQIVAMLVAALVVPLGYLLYELLIVGPGAIVNVPMNALQATVGAVLAYTAARALSRIKH